MVTTKAQRKALYRLYLRSPLGKTYRQFRKEDCHWGYFNDPVVMVEILGMWIGVEVDGYTHS